MTPAVPRRFVAPDEMRAAMDRTPRRAGEDVCSWLDRCCVAAGAMTLSQADAIQPDPEAWMDRDLEAVFGREPGSEG